MTNSTCRFILLFLFLFSCFVVNFFGFNPSLCHVGRGVMDVMGICPINLFIYIFSSISQISVSV